MDDLKARLLKPRLNEDTLPVEGVGELRVRGLSRAEALRVQTAKDEEHAERLILRFGVVEPELDDADIKTWQESSGAGEIENVTQRISELSGLGQGAEKEAMQNFRDGPDA